MEPHNPTDLDRAFETAIRALSSRPFAEHATSVGGTIGFNVDEGGDEYSCEVQYRECDSGLAALLSVQPVNRRGRGRAKYFSVKDDGSWTPDVAF